MALKSLVERQLRAHFPDRHELVVDLVAPPEGTGVNNETLLIEYRWQGPSGSHRDGAVLRLETKDNLFPGSSSDVHFQLYRQIRAVGKAPVPAVWGLDMSRSLLDRPFYFMEKVKGRVPPDQPPFHATGWVADLSTAKRRSMWEQTVGMMVALHATPVENVSFLDRPDLGASGLEQAFHHALGYMELALEGEPHRIVLTARNWLHDNFPSNPGTGLSWGDARPQNVMFDGTRLAGVLDWDMASLAGPEPDFAWWTVMDFASCVSRGVARLSGWGSPAATMALWEKLSGCRLRDMEWHFVFAAFRGAAIVMRLAKMLDAKELLPASSAGLRDNNRHIQYLASLLKLEPMAAGNEAWPGLGDAEGGYAWMPTAQTDLAKAIRWGVTNDR